MEVPEPQGTKFGLDQNGEQVAPIDVGRTS